MKADRNSAIWFVPDGFKPEGKLNGRRVAGESFLKGFFKHADVDEFVGVTLGPKGEAAFKKFAQNEGVTAPVRCVPKVKTNLIDPVSTVFISTPNFQEMLWDRGYFGHDKYSVCGVTHAISSSAVMEGIFQMRAGPQKPWDALICTSNAVKSAILRLFERSDDFLAERFGSVPPLPQLPVIPLGLDVENYAHNPKLRASFRKKKDWDEKDVVFTTVARLSLSSKFDPIPTFIAMKEAQEKLGRRKRLHYLVCGYYPDEHSRLIFENAAKEFLEADRFHFLNGTDRDNVHIALSAADAHIFPIDNLQESFGLGPVEAMSAGLPVIASDWNGLKDTISDEVGIRIPTMTTSAEQSAPEAQRYYRGFLSFEEYSTNTSAQIEISIPALSDAIFQMASKKSLRTRLGKKGLKRATEVYDWSVVIPQMQDLWEELSNIRRHAQAGSSTIPFAPASMDYLASFPTEIFDLDSTNFVIRETEYTVQDMYKLRRGYNLPRYFERVQTLVHIYDAISAAAPNAVSVKNIAELHNFNPNTVARCFVWLTKYGFLIRS